MIEELTLQGFKSYRKRQKIKFTQGVNKISGRNASGKTTLLEAILFGLFGDVPGINKQDLVTLGGGNMRVNLVFRSPYTGKKVKTFREGSLMKGGGFRTTKCYLEIEGETHAYTRERDIQARLRELLGIGKNVFFNIVYAKQKEFVEILNPSKNRMDAILGLTTPTEIREQFRDVKRKLETKGRVADRGAILERIKNAESSMSEEEKRLSDLGSRIIQITEGLEKKSSELKEIQIRYELLGNFIRGFRQLERQKSELEILKARKEDKERELKNIYGSIGSKPAEKKAELQAIRRSAEATEDRLRQIVDEELIEERRELDGNIARFEHQIKEHQELKEQGFTVCPKCGQTINPMLIEEDIERWQNGLNEEKGRLEVITSEIRIIQEQAQIAKEKRIKAEKEIVRFIEQERRIRELKNSLSQLDSRGTQLSNIIELENRKIFTLMKTKMDDSFLDLSQAQTEIENQMETIRRDLSSVQSDVKSYQVLLNEAKRQQNDVEKRLKTHKDALEASKSVLHRILEYEAKINAANSIQELYGEYEKQLRENTLRQLEWLTYKYFQRLTDQQTYSSCHIDRERYVLEVQPQGSPRFLPAWRAGGGHESLFALSERLALLRVTGFPHLLILDEPTDAVDSDNIPQLLEYIARTSQEINQVLLVTHHGYGEEEGVNIIRVKKVGGESQIIQEGEGI